MPLIPREKPPLDDDEAIARSQRELSEMGLDEDGEWLSEGDIAPDDDPFDSDD